jgi:hypothetical protein
VPAIHSESHLSATAERPGAPPAPGAPLVDVRNVHDLALLGTLGLD